MLKDRYRGALEGQEGFGINIQIHLVVGGLCDHGNELDAFINFYKRPDCLPLKVYLSYYPCKGIPGARFKRLK